MTTTLLKFSWRCAILALFCTAPAFAANGDQAQAAPTAKSRAQAKPARPVEEALNETPRLRRGLNNDAGVPPSGVPTETMHA